MVWKDLGSRRIKKSLERVKVRDDVKGQWFLMVYTWCIHSTHIVTEIKEYDIRAYGYGMVALR